jgi:hypothetical protein
MISDVGSKLELLFRRLASDGIEFGIRERVLAARIAAECAVAPKEEAGSENMLFLLRARLTPLLAKSSEEMNGIRRAFRDVFDSKLDRRPEPQPIPSPLNTLHARGHWPRHYYFTAIGALVLAAGVVLYAPSFRPAAPGVKKTTTAPSQSQAPTQDQPKKPDTPPVVAEPLDQSVTKEELGQIAERLVKAMGGGKRKVTILELALRMTGSEPTGANASNTISLFERYLSLPPEQEFVPTDVDLGRLVMALATRLYPGRIINSGALSAALAVSGLDTPGSDKIGATLPELPPISKGSSASSWLILAYIIVPAIPFAWWALGRRRRLKDYLRRRSPQRPPLFHELVVRSSTEVVREQTMLTRAAMRLSRARQGISRAIDVEATVLATACSAGRPTVVFASALANPEYLVLISTKGEDDHLSRQLDRLAAELAAQSVQVVRYFMAYNANLCFQTFQSNYFNLEQLADQYPDHRLIFLGDGSQLLNPGTLEAWPWAEGVKAWKRRTVFTPKPIDEWGPWEVSLARLFDGPPLRAHSASMLLLAELFERPDEIGAEGLRVGRSGAQWTWSSRPQRWLNPIAPDENALKRLESELVRYFTDDRGVPDEPAFWWLACCAIYPALRWDLTIYLGLKLRTPHPRIIEGTSFYSEDRAIRLAMLPWFREGFMPDWLRRRLVSLLPKALQAQAVTVLRDLLERAINCDGQVFDAMRLRVAQDWPDRAASRPERDEIFIDALAKHDSLALEAPRSLQDLKSGINNPFVAREWITLIILCCYWIGATLLAPWQSGETLGFGALLPLAILSLALITWPIAARFMGLGADSDDVHVRSAGEAEGN